MCSFPGLTSVENAVLSADLTREEIKQAAFDLGVFKATVPDDLQAFFYHEM